MVKSKRIVNKTSLIVPYNLAVVGGKTESSLVTIAYSYVVYKLHERLRKNQINHFYLLVYH